MMWTLFGAVVGGLIGNLFENGSPNFTKPLQPIGLPTVLGAAAGALVIPVIEGPTTIKISGVRAPSQLQPPPRQVLR
jgi:hypothetical protein